jgi:hypothetical protein
LCESRPKVIYTGEKRRQRRNDSPEEKKKNTKKWCKLTGMVVAGRWMGKTEDVASLPACDRM